MKTINKNKQQRFSLVVLFAFASLILSCNNGSTNDKSTDSSVMQSADTALTNNTHDTSMKANDSAVSNDTKAAQKNKKSGKRNVAAKIISPDVSTTMAMDKNGIYNRTEVLPTFPGGENALDNYLSNHIQYPEAALDNGTEGTVNVQFAVDEHGKVSNVKEAGTTVGDGLDEEALNVVSGMPNWIPGKIKGKNVKTYYSLPIVFSIQQNN